MSHNYASLNKAKAVIEEIGNSIRANGLPKEIAPMIFVFTGTGNVSKGAQEIFKLLPHQFVTAGGLEQVSKNPEAYRHKLVGCVVTAEDYASHLEKDHFTVDHYYEHPQEYKSIFHERIAPFASVIVNGIYWDSRFPRLLTKEQAKPLDKLIAICDISCDIHVWIYLTARAPSSLPMWPQPSIAHSFTTTPAPIRPHSSIMHSN